MIRNFTPLSANGASSTINISLRNSLISSQLDLRDDTEAYTYAPYCNSFMSDHGYEAYPSSPQHCFDQNHPEYRGRENCSFNSEFRSRPRSYERETCRHSHTPYSLFSIVNEDRRPFIREEDFSIPLYMETSLCCRGLFEIELKVLFSWTSRDLEEAVERETGMRSEDVDVFLKGRIGDMGLRDLVVDGRALMTLFRDGEVDCVLVRDKESDGKKE